MSMSHQEALSVLARYRGERIVVTTMTSVGIWPELSDLPLDFAYIPSAMGHAPSLGMGLALAQPDRGVIVVNGDGCMLMSPGALVTMATYRPNLVLIIMSNGLYEVTGGQEITGAGIVDFAQIAQGSGIKTVYTFDSKESWEKGAEGALSGTGPKVIVLTVEGRKGQKTPKPPRAMSDQISRLQEALGVKS